MPFNKVDVLDLASELDLQKMERIMSLHPENSVEVIYSPYILIIWKDQYDAIHISYFERQSEKDMKLAEDILNLRRVDKLVCQKVIHQNEDVRFPFAFMRWKE